MGPAAIRQYEYGSSFSCVPASVERLAGQRSGRRQAGAAMLRRCLCGDQICNGLFASIPEGPCAWTIQSRVTPASGPAKGREIVESWVFRKVVVICRSESFRPGAAIYLLHAYVGSKLWKAPENAVI